MVIDFVKNEEAEERKIASYIFPKKLAKRMMNVSQQIQYESNMMSMAFMIVGMFLTEVYLIFFMDFSLYFKIMIGINGVFGILFMASNLVSTYQQYVNYMDIEGFQKELQNIQEIEQERMLKTLKGGNSKNG